MISLKALLTPPEEHVAPARTREVRSLIVAVLTLVIAANTVAFFALSAAPKNIGQLITGDKWRRALHAETPVQWLFVGDSSCNQGLIPERITDATGGSALNLCTIGSDTLASDAWLLDAYADNAGAPGAIVMIHTWDMWERDDSVLRNGLWAIPGGPATWRGREPSLDPTPRDLFTARFGRFLPLWTQSASVRQAITSPGTHREIVFSPTGFMPVQEPSPARVAGDLDAHQRRVRTSEWTISEWNRAGLDALIKRTAELGVPLYLAMSPVNAQLESDPNFGEWVDAYAAMFATRAAENPHVHVLSDRPFPVAPELMENSDHVTTEGAERYSAFLGARLAELSASH